MPTTIASTTEEEISWQLADCNGGVSAKYLLPHKPAKP